MSMSRVQEWSKRFREGRMSLGDDTRSGAQKRVTDQHLAKVDELIKKDRRVTVDDISAAVVHDMVNRSHSHCSESALKGSKSGKVNYRITKREKWPPPSLFILLKNEKNPECCSRLNSDLSELQ
ncbi:hypothetical protein AVEN_121048-1 [Araneus ventricosus]|uniref:Mos1 transposase HTH domain-containing protein n=1 Tax=Araneus ventricosus TaxID=182803 RepID=A0A4Y2F2H8_ARAVE|nr:hypothetical protein AVEN_121048-1 [Araneus ventricosus]